MYYELINMVIDYKRRNKSAAYDATKIVGKIYGYQDLTNMLQMFLNHLLDIQNLCKTKKFLEKAKYWAEIGCTEISPIYLY